MRLRRLVAVTTASVLVLGLGAVSYADEGVPSGEEVSRARDAAEAADRDVAAVRAELAVAATEVEQSQVDAAIVAERWNGARFQLDEARAAAAQARANSRLAASDVATQRQNYADALVRSYQSAPTVSSVSAMVQADGISDYVEQRATMDNATAALEGRYDQFRASATVADLSASQAAEAEVRAADLEREALALRHRAEAAQQAAERRADQLSERRDELIAELARLEGVSVTLAERRQEGLEREAAERAAQARSAELEARAEESRAAEAAQQQSQQESQKESRRAAKAAAEKAEAATTQRARQQAREREWEAARVEAERQRAAERPTTRPAGDMDTTPAPSAGAAAAIAFAQAQLGEPYVWGGAGPNAWDCSGLTMKAWAAGGKTLPHWSVGQYRATTPVAASKLQPGDLVFWGDNATKPDTIFHVALYVGNGQIIHAPRTGRPVVQESITYWRTPDFYGRP